VLSGSTAIYEVAQLVREQGAAMPMLQECGVKPDMAPLVPAEFAERVAVV
jgi:hypothetical protein